MSCLDLLRDLDFAERSAREQQICNTDADSSTFEWIWEIQNSHSSFSQWLTDKQPVFWIQGKPGSGKSFLMEYLGTTDRVSKILNGPLGPQGIRTRFFFDFRADKSIANSLEGLLRSLILQVLKAVPSMEPELRHFKDKTSIVGNASEWNKRTLQEAFYKALTKTPSRLYIFADGLDEYSGEMYELLEFFQGLSDRSGKEGRLKICLASRPESVIDLALNAYPGFRMQDRNFEGIKQYVSRTISGLKAVARDKQRLEQLSADIAYSAEGVFLWARFAVFEIINGYAAGETSSELKRRLDELPSNMEGIYARIFGRLSANDRHEARLAFQLVCFAQHSRDRVDLEDDDNNIDSLTILQLKEAITVAKNRTKDFMHEDESDSLERFRRRIRAKCGGLLEEIPTAKTSEASEDDTDYGDEINDGRDDENDGDPKERTIKLIHRTVDSYLEREGWLLGCQIGDEDFASPHALWLYICCKCVKSMLGSSASRSRYTTVSNSRSGWILKSSFRHSLVRYASLYLFDHARCMEQQYQQSSYPFLSLVESKLWRYLQDDSRAFIPKGNPSIDWEVVDEGSDDQPWRIVVEQCLALCCGDLIKRNLHKPLGHGQDISLALLRYSEFSGDPGPPAVDQLIRLLIEPGSIVSQRNILECLYHGTASLLELLLDTWPRGAIQLNREELFIPRPSSLDDVREDTYDGKAVGPLWELARAHRGLDAFELMLDLFIARGESLDQSCGPGGTMLHALIVSSQDENYGYYGYLERLKILLKRGVNVNVRMFRIESFVTRVSF